MRSNHWLDISERSSLALCPHGCGWRSAIWWNPGDALRETASHETIHHPGEWTARKALADYRRKTARRKIA